VLNYRRLTVCLGTFSFLERKDLPLVGTFITGDSHVDYRPKHEFVVVDFSRPLSSIQRQDFCRAASMGVTNRELR